MPSSTLFSPSLAVMGAQEVVEVDPSCIGFGVLLFYHVVDRRVFAFKSKDCMATLSSFGSIVPEPSVEKVESFSDFLDFFSVSPGISYPFCLEGPRVYPYFAPLLRALSL